MSDRSSSVSWRTKLFVKAERCEFHWPTISFLGYVITAGSVQTRELLSVKMALEEWRHWLEVAEQPFLVWTDHYNLEYLRITKRLNSRQVRWVLLFTRSHFAASFRPVSKNVKPGVLSRLYSPATTPSDPETIIPF
jgi:hypothetical protein